MSITRFADLSLDRPLLSAVTEQGYTTPTEIQRNSIPHALAGRDLLAVAPTGTGKTAAFTLPMLQHLSKKPGNRAIRALVLAPTRELALQVNEAVTVYGKHLKLTSAVIMGGVNMNPQIRSLRRGVDILVATPGRLLDLMNQGHVKLDRVEFFVLDEADRMLDMGFIHDVRKIASKVPTHRQTLFFSATMPAPVAELAHTLLRDPARVDVAPVAAENTPQIEQRLMFVGNGDKQALLIDLLRKNSQGRILVFARTKHRADRVARKLNQSGIRAEAIHGNKTQGARVRTLEDFTSGRLRVLVGTDIVARGIDVDGISHVINFDLSDEPENYIHRIGRTARAGATGKAVSFCDPDEFTKLRQIERLIGGPIEIDATHAWHIDGVAQRREPQRPAARQSGQRPQGPRKPRWQHSRRGPRGSRRQPALMA